MFSLFQTTFTGRLLKIKNIDIYDNVFKIYSKLTVTLFIGFSILLSAKEYFGTPIDCIDVPPKRKSFVDNYCWITGTYTIRDLPGKLGKHFPYYGVSTDPIAKDNPYTYQRYYQWIVMILIVEAILFYIPSFLWKIWEHGRLKILCENLDSPIHVTDCDEQKEKIFQYLLHEKSYTLSLYAYRYFFCEFLNVIVVILTMSFTQILLPGFWLEYSYAVQAMFTSDWLKWDETSSKIFPKVAKCNIYGFGPSGSVQNTDALCLLSTNILNEKIFAFLWIWLIFLLAISIFNLIYRISVICSSNVRLHLIRSLIMSTNLSSIRLATDYCKLGKWFLLYQMGRNVNSTIFQQIIEELPTKINEFNKLEKSNEIDDYDTNV